MRKVLIFGNSGAGKSTSARRLVEKEGVAHLDLDILAWLPGTPLQRAHLRESKDKIDDFINSNSCWAIEGGYVDLLEHAASQANEIIFMNLSIDQCVNNARKRLWEPHKYKSKDEQNENLETLIDWIKGYAERNDIFSFRSHMKFYEEFTGKKCMHTKNEVHR